MKKIISIIMCLLLLCTINITALASNDKCAFELGAGTVSPGGLVAVPLKLTKNVGIWGFRVFVRFDKSVFSLKEIRNTEAVFKNGEILCGPESFNQDYVVVTANSTSLTKNNTLTGTVVTLYFNVASGASLSKYNFKLESESNSDFCNVDGDDVAVSLKGADVNVIENATQTTANEKNGGEVIQSAKSDKNTTKKANGSDENKTNSNEQATTYINATDKNGETVTDENGQPQTEEVVISTTQNATSDDAAQAVTTTNDDTKSDNNNWIIYLVICIVAVLALGAVLVFVMKKNKSANASKPKDTTKNDNSPKE